MHALLRTAVRAARQAGQLIVRYLDQVDRLQIDVKGRNDFVTQVDIAAEEEIISTIRALHPDHAILGEESGLLKGKPDNSEYRWVVDPLDGTTNFLHGMPHFAVSIALQRNQVTEQAVVYNPVSDELFTASKGNGAQLNDRRIRVSDVKSMGFALMATGFPFKRPQYLEQWISTFRQLMGNTSGVRRQGSAALDLAYVAAGRFEGYWEFGLSPWDMAAGYLLVQEAGGMVSGIGIDEDPYETGNIIAANDHLFEPFRELIRQSGQTDLVK